MFFIFALLLFQIVPNFCGPEPPFPMGNCGLYFRDRIETFDLTEAELNVENNKDQTENERRPWTVVLLKYEGRIASVRCGATIISPKMVITAASCFFDEKNREPLDMSDYSVVLGTNDPMNVTEGFERRLSRVMIHPKYKYPQAYFDIALIELEGKELEFTMTVHPVCLPSEIPDDIDKWEGRLIDIAGFGSEDGKTLLDAISMQGYPYSICDRSHFDDEDLTDLYREKAKIAMPNKYQDNLGCAKQYNRNEGLCPGDSGSTVGNDEDGRMVLVGVAQGVLLECSNRFPSIYTRTDHKDILPWIWRQAFDREFFQFGRPRYDRYYDPDDPDNN